MWLEDYNRKKLDSLDANLKNETIHNDALPFGQIIYNMLQVGMIHDEKIIR